MLELPLPATELIPQAAPMLLVDTLESCSGGLGRVRVRLRPECLFLSGDGTLDAPALVEMMAQTAASVQGYETRKRGGRIRVGFLVGLKEVFFHAAARVGDELVLESRRVFEMGEVSFTEARVLRGAECLAEGTLKLYESETLPPHPGAAEPVAVPEACPLPEDCPSPAAFSAVGRSLLGSLAQVGGLAPGQALEPEGLIHGAFRLPSSSPCFQGHFPGYPLQPGVVTLQMGLTLLESVTGRRPVLFSIEQAKFQLPTYPGDRLRVELRSLEHREGVRVLSVRIRRKDEAVAGCTCSVKDA